MPSLVPIEYQKRERITVSEFASIEVSLFAGLGSTKEAGGAISTSSILNVEVRFCSFDKDKALIGGGIYASGSNLHIYSTCFTSCYGITTSANDGGNAISFRSSCLPNYSRPLTALQEPKNVEMDRYAVLPHLLAHGT